MINKKISSTGYGFVIVSPTIFEQCRKEKSVKAKKMISYFSKDNDFFYYCISKGALIPIHHINYDRYELLFSIENQHESILNEWIIQAVWGEFNLQVDSSNEIWALEIEEMEKWNIKNLNKQTGYLKGVYYDIKDNEYTEYKGIKYNLPQGKYNVKVYGLSRKIKTDNGMENYGFLFELNSTEEFNLKIDPSQINFRELFE